MLLVNLCSSLLSLDYIQFVLITHQFICLWDTHNLRCMDLPSSTFLCVWRTYLLPHSTVSNPAVVAAVVACHRSISSPVLHLLYFLLRATVSTLAKMRNQGGVCVSLPLYLCVCVRAHARKRGRKHLWHQCLWLTGENIHFINHSCYYAAECKL